MQQAITETNRRRVIQETHNRTHGITPESIKKEVAPVFTFSSETSEVVADENKIAEPVETYGNLDDIDKMIKELDKDMKTAARALEFEKAAEIRDRIKALQKMVVFDA